jgi:L-iditol 2-dehydrogenase
MPEKSRAMVNYGAGVPWEMMVFPIPDPEPGAVITKITMSSICGSDVHTYKGELGSQTPGIKPKPRIGGHEFVGRVYKLGADVKTDTTGQPLKEGDRVAWCYFMECGQCYSCNHDAGRCSNWPMNMGSTFGKYPFFKGGFAEYYYVSPGQWIYKIPEAVPDEAAVYVDCAAATVAYGLSKVKFPFGATAVVMGAGGLGINAIPQAKDMGAARVIVIDKMTEKLRAAKSFGADYTIDYTEFPTPQARIDRVKQIAGEDGVNVVVEVVASSPEVVAEGLQMLVPGGTFLSMGLVGNGPRGPYTGQVEMERLITGHFNIVGSSTYRAWTMPQVLEFMARTIDKYPFDKVISHKFKLEDTEEALKQAATGKVLRAAIVMD